MLLKILTYLWLLHFVQMKVHNSVVHAVFNKNFSLFALFDGKYSTTFLPYQCYLTYLHRERDEKLILGLRKWLVDHSIGTDTLLFWSK